MERRTLRILLADDDAIDRKAIQRYARDNDLPYELDMAGSASECLELLRSREYDLVLLDYNLGDATGLELVDQISLPVVFVTGSGDEMIASQAMRKGAYGYLIKDPSLNYLSILPSTINAAIEKKDSEEKLNAQYSFLRTIIESLTHPFCVIDANTYDVMEANSAAKLERKDNIGAKCYEAFHGKKEPCKGEEHVCPMVIIKNTKKPFIAEHVHFDNNNAKRIIEVHSYPILAPSGEVEQIIEYNFDITDRKKAEHDLVKAKEAAEEATALKDKFVSLVSHDLKGPLTSVIGFLSLLKDSYGDNLVEEQKKLIDVSIKSGENMTKIIDDLLDISRIKTGKMALKPAFISANFLAAKALDAFGKQAQKKGIAMKSEVPEQSRLYADPALIYEVIHNLMSNAVKFCKKGDTISIGLNIGQPNSLEISDTGKGISPEFMENLFRYDVKTSSRGTAGEMGTGLGLPLCKDIVEAHGGELIATSRPGKGTTFSVRIPSVRPVVLIADDERMVRVFLSQILAKLDVEISEAATGKEALALAEKVKPHLIITDVMMPELDGFGMLKILRGDPKTRSLPVIILTADSSMETRNNAFRLGADDYLEKSADSKDIIPRIRRFIG